MGWKMISSNVHDDVVILRVQTFHFKQSGSVARIETRQCNATTIVIL